jgi:hypothetical protein
MDLGELEWEGVDLIHLAQDREQWRVLMNTVMILRVPYPSIHTYIHSHARTYICTTVHLYFLAYHSQNCCDFKPDLVSHYTAWSVLKP